MDSSQLVAYDDFVSYVLIVAIVSYVMLIVAIATIPGLLVCLQHSSVPMYIVYRGHV